MPESRFVKASRAALLQVLAHHGYNHDQQTMERVDRCLIARLIRGLMGVFASSNQPFISREAAAECNLLQSQEATQVLALASIAPSRCLAYRLKIIFCLARGSAIVIMTSARIGNRSELGVL